MFVLVPIPRISWADFSLSVDILFSKILLIIMLYFRVPKLFELASTYGILTQGHHNHKMAATVGGANCKAAMARGGANDRISGIEVINNSNSNASTFLAETLFYRMPFNLHNQP